MTGIIYTYLWDPVKPLKVTEAYPVWLDVPEHHQVMISLYHNDYTHSERHELEVSIITRQISRVTLEARSSWLTQVFDTDLVTVRYNITHWMKAKGFRLIYSFHHVRKAKRKQRVGTCMMKRA